MNKKISKLLYLAAASYSANGNTLTADGTGELDGAAYRVTLRQMEPETLIMPKTGHPNRAIT